MLPVPQRSSLIQFFCGAPAGLLHTLTTCRNVLPRKSVSLCAGYLYCLVILLCHLIIHHTCAYRISTADDFKVFLYLYRQVCLFFLNRQGSFVLICFPGTSLVLVTFDCPHFVFCYFSRYIFSFILWAGTRVLWQHSYLLIFSKLHHSSNICLLLLLYFIFSPCSNFSNAPVTPYYYPHVFALEVILLLCSL